MADLKADLNDNKKQIYMVQFKKGKNLKDFQQDGTFFLMIEDGTKLIEDGTKLIEDGTKIPGYRRITIFSDGRNELYQYYYPRDGKLFNETFELINKHESKSKSPSKSKSKSASKSASKSKSASASKSKSKSRSASSSASRSSSASSSASSSLPSLRSVSDSMYLTQSVKKEKSASASASASASPTVWSPINTINNTILTRKILEEEIKNKKNVKIGKKTTLDPLRATKIFGGKKSKKATRKKRT